MIRLSNEHISVDALCLVWSETDEQLVATVMYSGAEVSLTAIKAELEKHNSKSGLQINGDARGRVNGAQHGYVRLWGDFDDVNAMGHVLTLLHRNAHDPRMILAEPPKKLPDGTVVDAQQPHFYVVAMHGENLNTLFAERLQLALVWPIKVEWAEMLLQMGTDNGLVESLSVTVARELQPLMVTDPDLKGVAFTNGLRVVNDSDLWGQLITSAIEQNFIQI